MRYINPRFTYLLTLLTLPLPQLSVLRQQQQQQQRCNSSAAAAAGGGDTASSNLLIKN